MSTRYFTEILAACAVMTLVFFQGLPSVAQTKPAPQRGETAAIEELYRLELLPRLRTGETCKMFSSYDRTGGNDDGFSGTYSKLRVEEGDSVLAEMSGPGCIQRIWFAYSGHKEPGFLEKKGEHIRIYLDGKKTPALDVPLRYIFKGKSKGFPRPLIGGGLGGFYCYVPIPYRNGCKVVVDGTANRFYQITYRTFPSAEGIVSFQDSPTPRQHAALVAAVEEWRSRGELSTLCQETLQELEKPFSLSAGQSLEVALPPGPRMVRAVYLKSNQEPLQNTGGARLEIRWDGAETPAVDVPLDFFFCQAMQPGEFRSLLVGSTTNQWYNFMPMPYEKSAKVTLKAEKPFTATLAILTAKLPDWKGDLGYLHAVYHEELPTQTGKSYPWLNRQGRGHYLGTYLVTEGQTKQKIPSWLEGDEQFTVDGELHIHGTGSEDYFNCGWYAVPGRLNEPGAMPLHGFPVYRKQGERNLAAAYRWHVGDPVPYEKTIRAEIEHGPANNVNADYRSAAFFYDAAPE